ncbi:hypothetical protein C5D36_10310 [Rathayibacter sp. AY1C6]|uniref:hypothetical protein n=1 Tax=Rathayibacter sp. AY1C6 TaxID=2080539 RepID=UPI000CE8154C|nr:hypothetical protein [Rathayibacter sp. AY1C6]PPG15140.1 hypothetical protein C5D36_10310 [Rathayibacter sp. AY1C6]
MAYVPTVPVGQHLGASRLVDGAVVGHLFDDETNELRGHAAWHWVDDSDATGHEPPSYRSSDELTPEEREALARLVATIVIMVARAASPHVKRWWNRLALPTLREKWQQLRALRGAKGTKSHVGNDTPTTAKPDGAEQILVDLLATLKVTMSEEEWNGAFTKLLQAGSFTPEQLRVLQEVQNTATRVDSAAPLTETQFADRLQLVLQANPVLLTADTSHQLERALPLELTA